MFIFNIVDRLQDYPEVFRLLICKLSIFSKVIFLLVSNYFIHCLQKHRYLGLVSLCLLISLLEHISSSYTLSKSHMISPPLQVMYKKSQSICNYLLSEYQF